MDTSPPIAFAQIVTLAHAIFDQVEHSTDHTTKRAILRLQGAYRRYRVFVVELFSDGERKYRYYVLRGDWVEVGFDNDPDPRALKLKYGKIGSAHARKPIPHAHFENKMKLLLTEEMTFAKFVDWLETNLAR